MKLLFIISFFVPLYLFGQKKPLDHSVYDGWQSIAEHIISPDGKWVLYTVTPQEGDAMLYISQVSDKNTVMQIPRGYNALITADSRFAVCKIKPFYKDSREARIKKKKPEEFPKDSIAIIELGKGSVLKFAKARSFKMPEKSGGWLAWQIEKNPLKTSGPSLQKTVDSLRHTIDSLVLLVKQVKNIRSGNGDGEDADDDPALAATANEPSNLVLRNLSTGHEIIFRNVQDYYFNAQGQKLLLKLAKNSGDSTAKNAVVLYNLEKSLADTISRGGNDFRNFAITEDGNEIAFLAEKDTSSKGLLKYYGLYLYRTSDDSARLLVDKKSQDMKLGMTVSENGSLSFSKSGNRLFFGTMPLPSPKDTALIDFELARLDVWHYNDDYLQSQQLFQLNNELKRNYSAVYDLRTGKITQLGAKAFPVIIQTGEGDGDVFVAVTDTGRRIESQWTGKTIKDIYTIQVNTGKLTLVKKNLKGQVYASSTGRYVLMYDEKAKNYLCWNGKNTRQITSGIRVPFYNEENDVPDDPAPYGIMKWQKEDSAVFIYDRYGIWKVDPMGNKAPVMLIGDRKNKTIFRYMQTDPEEKSISAGQRLIFRTFNENNKKSGLYETIYSGNRKEMSSALKPVSMEMDVSTGIPVMSKNGNTFIYTLESYTASPDLYVWHSVNNEGWEGRRLSYINPQQSSYNWGTAKLYHWKALNGRTATGILYQPEDFDSTKKYPLLIYFYEKLSDGLNLYLPPAPTPSRLNIPFFVSRGYLVLAPDIIYTKGHPGRDAYNYVVSGAQSLIRKNWADAGKMGIQGQSWGGYQVAYMITATHMFKAAWAGAPVVNMFSAYGGIRWESGNNRQSQYEKGQSRIGATPWQRPDLYIENSPFFHLPKITTPLVIMSNDADGAVPWYQGIEFFTAMRRLNKKTWLLSYNGEAHNLVERRNRKDIQVREQQYFDWLLKGVPPAKWITDGVPAVLKGKDWGLE